MNRQKGFTLIELLVVIAIIGILSSVVLASLNSARGKGSDAAAKGGMNSLRSQAALYYDSNGQSYSSAAAGAGCTTASSLFADPQMKSIVTNIQSNVTSLTCYSSSTGWTAYGVLKGAGTNWCVDSNSNATATAPSAGAMCQ